MITWAKALIDQVCFNPTLKRGVINSLS